MKIITPAEWQAKQANRPQYKRTRCTKYQLINCLTAYYPELLSALRTAYEAQTEQGAALRFYWNSVLDLDRNNEDFQNACQLLGITEAQLDEIFSKIEGEEPAAVANN